MALRRPLYYDAGGMLREFNDTDLETFRTYFRYLWAISPGVSVSQDSTFPYSSNIPGGYWTNTYTYAGVADTGTTSFPSDVQTPNITVQSYTEGKLNQNIGTDSPTANATFEYPVYQIITGDVISIRCMTLQDMYDTFVDDAILDIVNDPEHRGTYTVRARIDASFTESTKTFIRQGSSNLFDDTYANLAAYTAAGIPERIDQLTIGTSYRLYRVSNDTALARPSYRRPLFAEDTGGSNWDLKEGSDSYMDGRFQSLMKNASQSQGNGRGIRYTCLTSQAGSATTPRIQGNTVTDRRYSNDTSGYTVSSVYNSGDDYRAQDFPNGTLQDVNQYALRIYAI